MNKKLGKRLEKYLSQVDRYLIHMPVSEKTDILSELKSSFYERLNNGQREEDILAEMEPAKVVALNYMGASIVQNKEFSLSQFMKVLGFYSFASMLWISIIPTLAVLAVSFSFASAMSILCAALGFIKGIWPSPLLNDMVFVFFDHEVSGVYALLAGILLAIVFATLAMLCWKVTVKIVQYLQEKSWRLKFRREKC